MLLLPLSITRSQSWDLEGNTVYDIPEREKIERRIVVLENPVSIQRETSISGDGYIVVNSFTYNGNTVCRFMETGTSLSPLLALEGIRYGWYECRLYASTLPASKSCSFQKDNGTLTAALAAAVVLSAFALIIGE